MYRLLRLWGERSPWLRSRYCNLAIVKMPDIIRAWYGESGSQFVRGI
ncbi:hypothetical protein [Roseofilum casamattae]|uniref:Uncharacterized protein n=1 Tax=Roseofilum casamattae BLCC-M143 TaxID=3022442 RepID=A0ABT7BYJ6_9CYAN|nr:hypothetical protein [Roseofilum casamattae]MDJ1183574.1 hypothetical protein [Roseofilum casamattae BLCC-M143]